MKGFISRIITRHSYPENNIVPRLPGKFESIEPVTQNLFENDVSTSDIGLTDNFEDIVNNRFIHHAQHKAHESIARASENNTEVLSDKSKAGIVKFSNANYQIPFIAKPATEINKYERSVLPNEDIPKIPKPSITDNEYNSDAAVNYKSSHNYNLNENNGGDKITISSGPLRFIASAAHEKGKNIRESTSLQIQQPLFTTFPTLQPDVAVPLISSEAKHQPVIKVHIGKIEIKAINQPSFNEVQTKNSIARKPAMSLDDYLKERNAR